MLKGAPVAKAITEDLVGRVACLKEAGVTPTLEILRVGEREDDLAYERGILKRAEKVGMAVRRTVLAADCGEREFMGQIARINADPKVHGCLMFRPLPAQLSEVAAAEALNPTKDVDGLTAGSLFGVFAGQELGFAPCTAAAVMEILAHYGVALDGAKATVVGRSLVIGRPVAMMLQRANATVTMCHTHTADLAAECRAADVLVVAAGHAGAVGPESVRPGQVVIDVGINWDEKNQRLCGDVATDAVEPVVAAITPVPGGVGAVTTAVLAKHVVEAAERKVEGR